MVRRGDATRRDSSPYPPSAMPCEPRSHGIADLKRGLTRVPVMFSNARGGFRVETSAMIYLRCNSLSANESWPGTGPRRWNVQPKLPEAMYRREPNVGAIAFLHDGDPNVGGFKDTVILKTFGEVPTISNGSNAQLTRRKGEYSTSRLDREFPYQMMLPAAAMHGRKGRGHSKLLQNLTLGPLHHSVLHLDR